MTTFNSSNTTYNTTQASPKPASQLQPRNGLSSQTKLRSAQPVQSDTDEFNSGTDVLSPPIGSTPNTPASPTKLTSSAPTSTPATINGFGEGERSKLDVAPSRNLGDAVLGDVISTFAQTTKILNNPETEEAINQLIDEAKNGAFNQKFRLRYSIIQDIIGELKADSSLPAKDGSRIVISKIYKDLDVKSPNYEIAADVGSEIVNLVGNEDQKQKFNKARANKDGAGMQAVMDELRSQLTEINGRTHGRIIGSPSLVKYGDGDADTTNLEGALRAMVAGTDPIFGVMKNGLGMENSSNIYASHPLLATFKAAGSDIGIPADNLKLADKAANEKLTEDYKKAQNEEIAGLLKETNWTVRRNIISNNIEEIVKKMGGKQPGENAAVYSELMLEMGRFRAVEAAIAIKSNVTQKTEGVPRNGDSTLNGDAVFQKDFGKINSLFGDLRKADEGVKDAAKEMQNSPYAKKIFQLFGPVFDPYLGNLTGPNLTSAYSISLAYQSVRNYFRDAIASKFNELLAKKKDNPEGEEVNHRTNIGFIGNLVNTTIESQFTIFDQTATGTVQKLQSFAQNVQRSRGNGGGGGGGGGGIN